MLFSYKSNQVHFVRLFGYSILHNINYSAKNDIAETIKSIRFNDKF